MRASIILQRFGRLVVALWVLVSLSFALIHLIPGDPVRASLGMLAPQELVETRRAELGLDRPLPAQYAAYLAQLARGDLGTSYAIRQPVTSIIAQRLPNTLQLAILALAIVLTAGITLGMYVAAMTWQGRRPAIDFSFNAVSSIVTAMPEFISAVALTATFAVLLRWLPVAGQSGAISYILPLLALAASPTAALARVVRVEALRVLSQDYMRAARAKRLSALRTYVIHALPNCLTATLTVGGLILCSLVAGTVLIENVFAWPGLGSAIVLSITQKDYPLTQGIILVLGALVLLINFAVDVLIAALDPRSALGEA